MPTYKMDCKCPNCGNVDQIEFKKGVDATWENRPNTFAMCSYCGFYKPGIAFNTFTFTKPADQHQGASQPDVLDELLRLLRQHDNLSHDLVENLINQVRAGLPDERSK